MLSNLFKKKFELIFSSNQGVFKDYLTKEDIEKLSKQEEHNNKFIVNGLISNIIEILNEIELKDLNLYNSKRFELLKDELSEIKQSINKKDINYLYSDFRAIFKNFIELIINQSWQSPDYGFNIIKQHGLTQKKIYSFYNDYQRYRSDCKDLEDILAKEYTDINSISKKVYLFNSGMAAFLCLINSFNDFDNKLKISSKDLYFEIDAFLKYKNNITFFDKENYKEIIDFIKENKPSYLFFDYLSNSPKLNNFNINILLDFYIKNPPNNEINIIIDTTLNFINFDLAKYFNNNFPDNLNIFMFRSLQKLDLYGLDSVSGGLLIHYGKSKLNIDGLRQMGFTPTEEQYLNFKFLPREFLNYRFKIISRNSLIIANSLKNIKSNNLINVYHPLLDNKGIAKKYILEGFYKKDSINIDDCPLFYFQLNKNFNVEDNNFFIREFLNKCSIENIPVTLGTSFGFNISRLMLVSDPENNIYVRFSTGIESIDNVFRICNILSEVIINFIESLVLFYSRENSFFNSKIIILEDYLKNIDNNINIDENIFKIEYLLKDIESNISKFSKNAKTKKFYIDTIEYVIEKIFKTLSILKDEKYNDYKKHLIRTIEQFYM
ncbi:MAG: hypothetical protein U0354_19055 [Candidatus Sericytochromatia bacterium]